MNNWVKYKIEIRERLKLFALAIMELSDKFPNTIKGRAINNQVTRSGTSTYANYRAAMRGRSQAEFYSKLCIAIEEADETEMWLDLIISSQLISEKHLIKIYQESIEIIKILSSMRKKLNENKKTR